MDRLPAPPAPARRLRAGRLLLPAAFILAPWFTSAEPLVDPMPEPMERSPAAERMPPPRASGTGICADLERGHLNLAALQLQRGASLDGPDPEDPRRRTPLVCAAGAGRTDAVAFLLSKGAKADVAHRELVGWATPLVVAAEKGHGAVVKLLIEAGAAVDARAGGWTALMFAAHAPDKRRAEGYLATLDALLAAGADPNATGERGETPLTLAIAGRNPTAVGRLARRGADPERRDGDGRTLLSLAAEAGDEEMVAALLAAGAKADATDRDGKTAWVRALEQGAQTIMTQLVRAGARERFAAADLDRAFPSAVCHGDLALVKRLVGSHAAELAKGRRFGAGIVQAARCARVETTRFLLANGADPDAADGEGETPLVAALTDLSSTGREAAIRTRVAALLAARGADVNARAPRGATPLLAAVTWDNRPSVKLLLARRADPNLAGGDGDLPLAAAVRKRDLESARALVGAGADPNAAGPDGRTPWTVATEAGDREMAALLEKAGARPDHASLRWRGRESRIATSWAGAVTTDAEWIGLWRRAFGKDAPRIDFSRHFVACAFLGRAADGWYEIHLGEPAVRGGELVIEYALAELQVSARPGATRAGEAGGPYAMRVYARRGALPIAVRGR